MFDRIKTLVQKWHDLKEVAALTERDLNDLGMTRDQVQRFVQMPADVGERVTHMAQVFGIAGEDLRANYPAYVALLETCGSCTARRECARVLALGDAAKPGQCDFCRNARTFSDLAA